MEIDLELQFGRDSEEAREDRRKRAQADYDFSKRQSGVKSIKPDKRPVTTPDEDLADLKRDFAIAVNEVVERRNRLDALVAAGEATQDEITSLQNSILISAQVLAEYAKMIADHERDVTLAPLLGTKE